MENGYSGLELHLITTTKTRECDVETGGEKREFDIEGKREKKDK